jgi:hypothetical protein
MISAVQFDRPFFKTIHQLFEGSLITPSTLPVDELTGITTVGFPDPKFVFLNLKKVVCVKFCNLVPVHAQISANFFGNLYFVFWK